MSERVHIIMSLFFIFDAVNRNQEYFAHRMSTQLGLRLWKLVALSVTANVRKQASIHNKMGRAI